MPRSIAEIRKANGGLENLTDEDILQSTFQQYKSYYPTLDAYAADVGYGGAGRGLSGSRISAGVDQYQANLLGLGGAVARGVGAEGVAGAFDRRRVANEDAAAYAAQRARDLGGVEDWRDVEGVGSALNYVGGLGAQSLPYLGEAVAGALTGGAALAGTAARMGLSRAAARTAGAVGAGYPSAVGDVLSAQRESGGELLGSAALGGVPYAALNALGVEGLLARGLRPLATGQGGIARRTATGAGVTALGEGLSETGQELVNQYFGRMAVDPGETLFNEEANKRYLDSFVGGAALGGVFGGVGGIRGPRQPETERDLTTTEITPVPRTGLDTATLMGSPYAAANPLGGTYAGIPLVTPAILNQETDLTAPAATTAAGETKPTVPSIFSELDTTLNKLGIKPTKNSRGIYEYMVAEGIDPASPEAEPVLNALANSKLGEARKAVGEIIRARSPRGTGVSTVQQPAGGLGVGSPVVQGAVGDAGRVAPVAGAVGGGAPAAGAPLQQTSVLPSTTGQPPTPVTTTAPAVALGQPSTTGALSGPQASQTIETAPQGQTTTRGAAGTTALVDTSDDALEIARATGNASEIEAMREDEAGLRGEQRDFTENDLNDLIDEQLGKGKNKERDRKILRAYILSRRMETEGDKGNLVEEIANTFGITEDRVRQIGNPEKLARLAVSKGFDSNQVFDLLGIESAQKKVATKLGKLKGELDRLKKKANPSKADTARMAELDEQITRISDAAESGDMAVAFREAGIEGEAGEAFGNLDDAREWQKASTAGSQLAVDLVSIADNIAELKATAAELKDLGLAQAEAAAVARIDELTAKYEALVASATAPKAERKKAKAKTETAQVAAEEKDAAKEAEAAKFRAERAAKLESDRKGLAVGDTVMNPKLGTGVVKSFAGDGDATTVTVAFRSGQTKELSVKLAKLEKTDAVQVESTASVSVQPETDSGKKDGGQVRRAPKPATEGKAATPAVPAKVLTEAEQAAQAWDVVAADFPQAPKFADLTKAQQENFIEFGPGNWERGDVELELTKLARGDTKFNALRTVTTTDENNVSVDLQEQELSRLENVPGVGAATARFRSEGLGNLIDYVGGWYTTDSKVDWDGGFTAVDGQAAVLLRRGMLTDSQRTEWTVYHEVGHAADQTHLGGGGVFSGQPEFNVRIEKGQIKPMGAVMKAAFDYYNSDPTSDLSKHLSYPFDRKQHGDLNAQGVREELFAQLWATYTTRDGRAFLEDNLPAVADFMEQAYEQAKQTDYAAAAANETQLAAQAGSQAAQGDGQPRQVPLRQATIPFRALRQRQGLIDRNIAKLPKMAQQPVRNTVGALGDLGGRYLDYAVFTSDLVKRGVAAGMPSAQKFADVLARRAARVSELEREIEKIADGYANIEQQFKGSARGSVNDFLFESTRTGKWGYGKFRDTKMGAEFDKLGPKAQKFVKDVFAHGDKALSDKKKIVLDAATSEYDAMIQAAQDAVNAAQIAVNTAADAKAKIDAEKQLDERKQDLAEVKAEKAASLERFQTLFRIREGLPYAPIKRNGTQVVIGKSDEYKAAVAAKDTKRVKELESDPDHYHVSFADSKWEARTLRDKLKEQGVFTELDIVTRSQAFEEAFSGEALLPALTKMRAAVDKRAVDPNGKKDPTAGKMLSIINQLYLEALAEGSARKSEMRRRGVAGEVDMLQSFTQQGRADANFMSNVQFEPLVQDQLQNMRNESRSGDRERKSEIFNELTQRYAGSLDVKVNSWVNGLTNLASKFFLASSPAYYMQNLTQPFMMSLPAMAGRHDYTKAASEMVKAYTELGPLFRDVKLFDQQFDFSKVPADVRTAINELVNQGKIDIGLATEINEYKVDADGNLSKFAQRLNKGMRMAVQKTEAVNRLSTAIAAYRLEYAKTKDAAKATQYAADILSDTHGDYTAFNAPRAFNTQWGKVALQFRKFQLIQISFFYKLFRDAFTNPAERAAAIKSLTYALGHTAVFAGLMGLPGYAAISAILSAFGDEDEPFDLTAWSREQLGPEWADMIMRGAPTVVGMDLSGKIGAGTMLSIMPFSNADLSTASGRAEAFGTLMGGASLGMTTRVADGLLLMSKGDYYKGLERVMPKGVSDALKSGRQATEGMTRRNGDVILPESEIGAIETVLTGLGVPSVQQSVTYERQNRMRDITKNFQDRTTRIKNDYAKAVRQKDTAAMQEAREAWTKLQQARQRNGLKPQPVSNLLKAPQEQAQREKRTVGGVSYREGQRQLAEQVAAN
jgi:hypothetical protein